MADNPQVDNPSRRSLFKIALGAGAMALGLGALETFGTKETSEQRRARAILEDENISKPKWNVISHPDVIEKHGLAVRPYPKAPFPGEGDHVLKKLQPGEQISGVIWQGRDIRTHQEDTPSWVAFMFKEKPEDKDLTVGFVAKDYLSTIVE